MSCSCTHIDYWNPCQCGASIVNITTTTTTTTLCLNGEPCEESIDLNCIIYCGSNIPCWGIETGQTAQEILAIVMAAANCIPFTTTTTSTTSTTTTSTTTTTTTAAPVPQSEFGVDNQLSSGAEIDVVTFNLTAVTLDIPYPVTPGQAGVGLEDNGTYTVEVFFIGAAGGETITVTDSTGAITCVTLTTGQISQTFIGQVLNDTLGIFSIVLSSVPC